MFLIIDKRLSLTGKARQSRVRRLLGAHLSALRVLYLLPLFQGDG